MCDEIFGRVNFINQISVKMKLTAGASGGGEDKKLKKNIEYLLSYAKDYNNGFDKFNDVFDEENLFDIIDEMEANKQSWKYTSILVNKGDFIEERTILDGSGEPIKVKKYKGLQRINVNELIKNGVTREEAYLQNFDWLFSDTNAQTSIRTRIIEEFTSLERDELLVASYIPKSGRDKNREVEHYYISPTVRRVIWLKDTAEKREKLLFKREKVGTYWQGMALNNLTKEGEVRFPNGKKPEALLRKIMELATNPGDLVLDSFAGSGTTGAVAQKMGRRWIMIELGEHCHTHIIPRLQKVIDNQDSGGITKAVNWQGGGGFRYFKLAPSLLEKDKYDNWIISPKYNSAMLAEAMCKLMGFTYAPSQTHYWNQGYSSESDHIYVTTNTLNYDELNAINQELRDDQTLLICCKAFRTNPDDFPKLTIKKIPQSVLHQCEWDHDDYSLNVANLKTLEKPPQPIQTQQLSLL